VLAGVLLASETRTARHAQRLWPAILGAALIVGRLALLPSTSGMLQAPPDGEGPWSMVVITSGSPHDGQQTATLSTPSGVSPAFIVAATLPRYPEIAAGDPVVVAGAIRPRPDSAYGDYLARIGAIGTLT